MRRFGMVVRLKKDHYEAYKTYHQIENIWPEILELGKACHIINQTIYYRNGLLFRYFEYDGDDYEADMAKAAAHPKNQAWQTMMTTMMEPMEDAADGEWWVEMEEIVHTD